MSLTPVPTGNDIRVNTTTLDAQRFSTVTARDGGGFLVTYTSREDVEGNVLTQGIYGRLYNADGQPTGDSFRINSILPAAQELSSAAALPGGGFVVTWRSQNGFNTGDGSGNGIFARIIGSNGQPIGTDFQVNSFTTNNQEFPSVTVLDDGGFVITWHSQFQDRNDGSGGLGIYGQRYNAVGSPVGGEFLINTFTINDQAFPSVASLPGGFVVIWQSLFQGEQGNGIFGQRYNADGSPAGGEFRVNTTTDGDQVTPSVTALVDGGFVVTWAGTGATASDIYGQRYGADGSPAGAEFRVNTFLANDQTLPAITALADGGFVIAWMYRDPASNATNVIGQRFGADGLPAGEEFQIEQNFAPSLGDVSAGEWITQLADGRLVATWPAGFGDSDVYIRFIEVPGGGGNTPPVLTAVDVTGAVTEDDATPTLTDSGSISFADADVGAAVSSSVALTSTATTGAAITSGLSDALAAALTIAQTGTASGSIAWAFALDNALTQYLGDGDTITATYTITADDGTGAANATATQDVTVTITGVNDDATITGTAAGSVTEDGTLTASGALVVADADSGENRFRAIDPSALRGTYGLFSFNPVTGDWSYDLDNAATAVQALGDGATRTDTLLVTSDDGTASETITVTVGGVNDLATISGTATGSVTKDGTLFDSGTLIVTDVDTGEDDFLAVDIAALQGDYGVFSFDSDTGAWTYTLDNALAAGLDAGDVRTETLTVRSRDGTATETITITVNGASEGVIITNGNRSGKLYGTGDDDVFRPAGGFDIAFGGAGDDRFIASANDGIDVYVGGAGIDTVDYSEITAPVSIDLLGLAFGPSTSTDILVGIENAIGGSGNDRITGTAAANRLEGGGGADWLSGGAGNDWLSGGSGDDWLSGGSGNDWLSGGSGNDWLSGGSGNDWLDGGSGNDVFTGGPGSDVIVLNPGFGNDRVTDFDANPSGGQDFIDLSGFDFTEATFYERVAISQVGADTLITIDDTHTLLLQLVGNAATVTLADFIL